MAIDDEARGMAGRALRYIPGVPLIGIFGDSITAQNTKAATGTTADSYAAIGYLHQALAKLKGRARTRINLNFGVSGDNTTQMLARVGTVAASDANIIVVLGGTNDTPGLTAISTITGNMQAIYEMLLAAGKVVIAIPILPRTPFSGSSSVSNSRKTVLAFNNWLRRYAYTQRLGRFFVADGDVAMMDYGSATGDPIANSTYDGLHPMSYGAQLVGGALYTVLDRILPPRADQIYSQADVFDATYNPRGSVSNNPKMTGTGGTAGTGISGTVADAYTMARNIGSTLTATASKGALAAPNGGASQVIELGGGTAGATTERIRFYQTINAGGSTFSSGDVVYGEIEVDQASLVNVQYISLLVNHNDGVTVTSHYGLYPYADVDDREIADNSRVIRTPEFTVPAYAGSGTQTIGIYLYIDAACDGAGVSGTITVKTMALRKAIGGL